MILLHNAPLIFKRKICGNNFRKWRKATAKLKSED